jgi:glycosyltransferase involved in cell wall biosynthesis
MAKISIIIPNYNNAQYLDRCLKSAINQTYKDIEIICIDDKSTDDSLDVLKKYEDIENVKIIRLTENGGVSNARNIALSQIDSEYVCFLDSDDYIEKDFCIDLLNNIISSKSDLSCGGHIKINKFNRRISAWLPKKAFSDKPNEDIYYFTKHRNVTQKLFKTEIIKNNNILFEKNLNYMEDALFLVTYLKHCKYITGVERVLYDVQINPNSLCRSEQYKERRESDSANASSKITSMLKDNM